MTQYVSKLSSGTRLESEAGSPIEPPSLLNSACYSLANTRFVYRERGATARNSVITATLYEAVDEIFEGYVLVRSSTWGSNNSCSETGPVSSLLSAECQSVKSLTR